MDAAMQEVVFEQRAHVLLADRTIGNPPVRRTDFHDGLQPEHAARAVAHQTYIGPAQRRFGEDGFCNVVGAKRQRCRIAWDMDSDAHCTPRFALMRALKRSGVTRAYNSSPIAIFGPTEHRPRQ